MIRLLYGIYCCECFFIVYYFMIKLILYGMVVVRLVCLCCVVNSVMGLGQVFVF